MILADVGMHCVVGAGAVVTKPLPDSVVAAGVVVVNAGTHGSEPHMGFGGVKQSGTGWKEAGVEALDVYSETQYVNLVVDPSST